MNSFYKKVALACLVSLTANQAAQAFEFSDILDWIKGNQKTSAAIVAGIVACVILVLFKSKRNSIAVENDQPVVPSGSTYTYATFVDWLPVNDQNHPFKNVKSIKALTGERIDVLEKMLGHINKYGYLCLVTDEQDKIVSAAQCLGGGRNKRYIHIESYRNIEALKLVIETGLDVSVGSKLTDTDSLKGLEEAIQKVDGDVKPKKSIEQGQIFFNRDPARELGCINTSLS